jgi:hypothetical protein
MGAFHVRIFLERRPCRLRMQVVDQRKDLFRRRRDHRRTNDPERIRLDRGVDQRRRNGDRERDGDDDEDCRDHVSPQTVSGVPGIGALQDFQIEFLHSRPRFRGDERSKS